MTAHLLVSVLALPISASLPLVFPASAKRTFLKMHIYQSDGMISHFNGMKNHAYWVCARINK